MRLTIRYGSASAFGALLDEMRARSGALVRVEDRDLAPGSPLEVVLETPGGTITVSATVIQVISGQGLALSFDADAPDVVMVADAARRRANISETPVRAAWIEASSVDDRGAEDADDEDAETIDVSLEPETGSVNRARAATDIPVRERLKTATKVEKMQLALRGSRAERNALIRDRDKSLHQYVIRNARIGLDEVAAIARMTTVAPEVLKVIAAKRDWFQRPEIAAGLCRNPRVSAAVARKLLAYVSSQELRQMAKGQGVREAIAAEARKRILR